MDDRCCGNDIDLRCVDGCQYGAETVQSSANYVPYRAQRTYMEERTVMVGTGSVRTDVWVIVTITVFWLMIAKQKAWDSTTAVGFLRARRQLSAWHSNKSTMHGRYILTSNQPARTWFGGLEMATPTNKQTAKRILSWNILGQQSRLQDEILSDESKAPRTNYEKLNWERQRKLCFWRSWDVRNICVTMGWSLSAEYGHDNPKMDKILRLFQ